LGAVAETSILFLFTAEKEIICAIFVAKPSSTKTITTFFANIAVTNWTFFEELGVLRSGTITTVRCYWHTFIITDERIWSAHNLSALGVAGSILPANY
jgi:hypothetical protein